MNNFYNIDSFEQFLRDNTKDFKMLPQKRVWFSIYNNLHPSKKIPSLFTSLFFLFIFFSIDLLNTNFAVNNKFEKQSEIKNVKLNNVKLFLNDNPSPSNQRNLLLGNKTNNIILKSSGLKNNKKENNKIIVEDNIKNFDLATCDIVEAKQSKILVNSVKFDNTIIENNNYYNSVFNSNKNEKNHSNNLSYEIYASPSITFRDLNKEISKTDEVNTNNQKKNIRYSDLNLYAGGAILYNINSSVRIKAGLELRYTKSSFSNLLDQNTVNEFSNKSIENSTFYFLNNNQNTLLELNSYNISLPIGSEFELAGNDRIHWYAAASIEPTYKIYDNPVLKNNENQSIYDNYKSRKWNLNSNFETFLSLKINKNSFFNAGPQFRYQLFSRYNNLINPYNNSYNFGMKLGISKTF